MMAGSLKRADPEEALHGSRATVDSGSKGSFRSKSCREYRTCSHLGDLGLTENSDTVPCDEDENILLIRAMRDSNVSGPKLSRDVQFWAFS